MQTGFILLKNPAECDATVPCALRLFAPEREESQRQATHFILVLDISESMADGNKLGNVKHSVSLVLNFLGPTDYLTVITFGDEAKVRCSAVQCDSTNKDAILATIQSIRPDGCTNLSAGLLNIKNVLDEVATAGGPAARLKPGVLLLTDGHANRGSSSVSGLLAIIQTLYTQFPALSLSLVGYGTDHNAELLKSMAEQTQGSYSIVEDREGAATVVGDTLGSLFSCAAQMVKVGCPAGTTVAGQFRVGADGCILVGDVFEGAETVLLLEVPKGVLGQPLAVTGVQLPSLERFEIQVQTGAAWSEEISDADRAFRVAAELTKLRYRCSALFKEIGAVSSSTAAPVREKLQADINAFKAAVEVPAYNDNPIATMLRAECSPLQEAYQLACARWGAHDSDLNTRLFQHSAFTALGRGTTTQTMQRGRSDSNEDPTPYGVMAAGSMPHDPAAPPRVHFAPRASGGAALGAAPSVYLTSPSATRIQRRVTNLISTMSMAPQDSDAVHEALQEANTMSQQGQGQGV